MLHKILFTLVLTLLPAAPLFAQSRYHTTYAQLKDFKGRYEAAGGSTLDIAASPWDTLLYAILGKAKYPLRPAAKDVFLNNGNQQVG
ncbi:hypothetical protein DCC81_16315 [Chitinophaga parva]|uniref:ABC transporter substrate-binding protein n=1 Tax=Chitinophaga parva TaxID=2169414 RepID=A0A2T7BHQ3_9BACT|nr:hypothetical protein [Chitinophaga parva]PUZ25821.1 hypothetical protein DCC81_16315 [Chitinophaga parva]